MAKNSYKIKKSLNLQAIPTTAIAIDQAGDLAFDSTLDKLQLQDSVGTHSVVTEDVAATLTNKTLTSPVITAPTGITKADVGLGNVDNTSDATKNAATATLTNKTITSPVITTPTGIVKGDVGLGNVDNTSDATKNAATATLTNKTISGASNTITGVSLTSGVTGTLPIANGGTGQTTANAALNALLPSQAGQSGNYLSTNGTTTSWSASTVTFTPPTFQRITSGSTYNTPVGVKYIIVEMVGGGGGGAGGGTNNTGMAGNDGTDTIFNSIIAHGGLGATNWATSTAGAVGGSGTAISGSILDAQAGGHGQGSQWAQLTGVAIMGGQGGASRFSGQGAGGGNVVNISTDVNGISAVANTGSGGGGAGCYQGAGTQAYSGGGGGGGEYLKLYIVTPASSYSYSLGIGGSGGPASGSGGGVGGNGANGIIIVSEYYG